MKSLKTLYSDARHYSRQLASAGDRLLVTQRLAKIHPELLQPSARTYATIARGLVWAYGEIRRALTSGKFRANPQRQSLELLERLFLSLLETWSDAEYRVSRLKKAGGKGKAMKAAEMAADLLAAELERVAKLLVVEADKLGRWTVQWERDLGLRQWLR